MKGLNKGFTLIEMMITIAIIGILAAIAYPSYTDYLRRGAIPEGLAALSSDKVRMEQFFMDNRTYTGGCRANYIVGRFTISCALVAANPGAVPPTAAGYRLTATGAGIIAGFVYTLNNVNTKQTVSTGVWGQSALNTDIPPRTCWILKSDGSC